VNAIREADLDPLMARLARGDRSAFDELYTTLQPRALRLAEAKLGAGRGADVAQSALLKVFSRASDFEPGRPCLPWFYAIVANEIRSARRKEARLVADPTAGEGVVAEDATAEDQLLARELERSLRLAIDGLDDDAAAALRAMLGLAPLPSTSPVTFRKRVSRAYAKLRLALGGHDVG